MHCLPAIDDSTAGAGTPAPTQRELFLSLCCLCCAVFFLYFLLRHRNAVLSFILSHLYFIILCGSRSLITLFRSLKARRARHIFFYFEWVKLHICISIYMLLNILKKEMKNHVQHLYAQTHNIIPYIFILRGESVWVENYIIY